MRGDDGLGAAEIAGMLADRVIELAGELLPGGKRHGRWFRAGSVYGEAGQSLAVELAGPRRGRWRDFNDIDKFGDLVDLVRWSRCGGDLGKAFQWSRSWLGVESARPRSAQDAARSKAEAAARRASDQAEAEREAADNRARARRIWDKGRPLARGDPVDEYLKGRGIDLAVLGRAPAALRYAPSLWHGPGQRFPAMLGAITDGAGEFLAVHRTWLERQVGGGVKKAPVAEPKKTLGPYRGGSIKLSRGASGKPWLNMPMGSTIAVAEGTEDGLSALIGVAVSFPTRRGGAQQPVPVSNLRTICGVSLDNLGALELPAQVARVVILSQRDAGGAVAKLAAAIEQLQAAGLEVLLLPPPAWPGVKDLNDMVGALRAA